MLARQTINERVLDCCHDVDGSLTSVTVQCAYRLDIRRNRDARTVELDYQQAVKPEGK
jgi:hypothetical protein